MFESIFKSGSGLIESEQVLAAQEAGLLIHHEVETQDFDGEDIITRDDWYAATAEFVESYYSNGGTWYYL